MTLNSLEDTVKFVKKNMGEHSVEAGDVPSFFTHIPTGVFALDFATAGGIPESLITCIYGWASGGKSTLTYKIVANAQKKYPNKTVVWLDAEGTLKAAKPWAEVNGVDFSKLLIVDGIVGQEMLDVADAFLKTEGVSLVIVDSIPALLNRQVQEKSVEDKTMAATANMLEPFIKKANLSLINAKTQGDQKTLIMINQWREKPVFMGDNRVLPGGQAQNFFYSLKIEVKNKESLERDSAGLEIPQYNTHTFTIAKNKVCSGIKSAEFVLVRDDSYGLPRGTVDDYDVVVTFAQKLGYVGGAGAGWWYIDPTTGEQIKTKSKKEISEVFKNDEELFTEMKKLLISKQRGRMGLAEGGWY